MKEVALSTDPDREIAFGADSVRLGDVHDWFSAKARAHSRRIMLAAYPAVGAAVLSVFSLVILALFVKFFKRNRTCCHVRSFGCTYSPMVPSASLGSIRPRLFRVQDK
jgi:hypothetical protein